MPPFRICKLIPAGEFKKTVFVWEVSVWETLDDNGNVVDYGKFLALIDRDAAGKMRRVPKTARQKLNQLRYFQPENNTIYYREAIYPAPTLQEVLDEIKRKDFLFMHDIYGGLWEAGYSKWGVAARDKNPLICAMKIWLGQRQIEV